MLNNDNRHYYGERNIFEPNKICVVLTNMIKSKIEIVK